MHARADSSDVARRDRRTAAAARPSPSRANVTGSGTTFSSRSGRRSAARRRAERRWGSGYRSNDASLLGT
jgi:hypothetical protein